MAALHRSIPLQDGWRYRSMTATESSVSSWQSSRRLPTEIHLDLLANGAIPDPFRGRNEDAVQWVGEQTWLYETEFEVPEDVFGSMYSRAALVFEGLDTIATVRLNDSEILTSDSMFVSHRVELSQDMLVEGPQRLQITFESAERVGDEEVLKYPQHDWLTFNSGTARLATRKAQYHFGWDWGPKLMTCGPWKPIFLDLYSSRILDFSVRAELGADLQYADVEVVVEVEASATQANITLRQEGVVQHARMVDVKRNIARAVFRLHSPDLWWPFTLGQASLYEASISLYGRTSGSQPNLVDKMTKRFGIRKVELVQHALPNQEGTSFFFKINNVPLFASGSCWIPADSFTSRISAQRYKDWVKLARDSNQVVIRVWGGGVYEHEAFYNTCDELGVLVWQDFMFACGNYPAHPDMRKRVAVEAHQNVRRLRHHPSIVLWCGNNEDYIMPLIRKVGYDPDEHNPEKILESNFPARYFYEHMLPAICTDLTPGTPYWPGSPFGGSMVNSPEIGDIHQWHVWHLEMAPYQDFPKLAGRFVSEFGMQALPCLATAREFFPPGYAVAGGSDISQDEFVKWHNKMDDGGERIAHYGNGNIDFETKSLPEYIYSTQLIQSETLSTAYRSWRRLWQGPGKEYCGGALAWQLNDCWPVTSWAVADYYLRPKMAYWAVKRECAGITAGISRIKDGDQTVALDVWAVNMTQAEVEVGVFIHAWEVSTGKSLFQKVIHNAHLLRKNRSTELARLVLDELVPVVFSGGQKQSNYKDVVFALRLINGPTSNMDTVSSMTGKEKSVAVLAQTVNFYEPLREVPFQAQSADLKLKIVRQDGETFVEIATTVPVKGLLVQVTDDPDATWDDNGIDLVPDQIVRLRCIRSSLETGQEHRLQARWLGGEWQGQGQEIIRALL